MDNTLQHIEEVLHHCIHCGMCLPVCPTYALTNDEQSSPRGRIRLMQSFHEGTLGAGRAFVDEMYFCLDCQACQTACPAGVQYGVLVEDARNIIAEQGREPWALRFMKRIVLRGILSSKSRTKTTAALLRWYRRSGLQEAVDSSGILAFFSETLAAQHAMLPTLADRDFDDQTGEVVPATGAQRGRVGLLTGCVMNSVFPGIHRDVVDVLSRNGFEIVIPKAQVCCGALHAHYGDIEEARRLARINIDVFGKLGVDAVIADSAGCAAFLKEYGTVLRDDDRYAARAKLVASSAREITEFLADAGFASPARVEESSPREGVRVTYHDACHLVHTQNISRQPREITRAVPGIEFLELPEATWCCGSAGIYNVLRFSDSMKLLDRKMANIAGLHADIVLTANPGCHLQLVYGLRKCGLKAEVLHPVSLLNRWYRSQGNPGHSSAHLTPVNGSSG